MKLVTALRMRQSRHLAVPTAPGSHRLDPLRWMALLIMLAALASGSAAASVAAAGSPPRAMNPLGVGHEPGAVPVFVALPALERGAPGAPSGSSDAIVELVHEHVVRPGESLALLAARYGVSVREIVRRNELDGAGFDPDRAAAESIFPSGQTGEGLVSGRRLSIVSRHIVPVLPEPGVGANEVIVNIPQRMLFRFADGRLAGAWPVAVGRPGWETPVTRFRIVNRLQDPVWYVPRSIQAEMRREGRRVRTVVEPGPDNPLGGYWLGIDLPGFGLHATNEAETGYGFASHGCVRLSPDDMAVLFRQLQVGDRGSFMYRSVLLARSADGRIWLEVNPDAYALETQSVDSIREMARQQAFDLTAIDWARVRAILDEQAGIASDITASRRAGISPDS